MKDVLIVEDDLGIGVNYIKPFFKGTYTCPKTAQPQNTLLLKKKFLPFISLESPPANLLL